MNAPALANTVTTAPGQAAPAAAQGAAASSAGSLAGFEALLAALLPQDPTVAAMAATGMKPLAGEQADSAKAGEESKETADGANADVVPAAQPDSTAGDANAALMASMMAGQPVVAEAAAAPARPAGSDATPPAWGRGKAPGVPAAPALANRGELLPVGADADTASAPEQPEHNASAPFDVAPRAGKTQPAAGDPRPSQPASSRAAAAAPDLAPIPAAQTADVPEASASAATAAAPAVETAAVDTATLQPGLATAQAAKPEPAPAQAPRASRTERARAAEDARVDGARVATPGIRPNAAKAAAADARSPGEQVELMDPALAETDSEDAESPDGVMQAEARASAQSLTPAAHASHAVRGSPETVANLAAQIIKKLEGKSTRFDLELNPAGLGRVDVRLEIGAHGRITAAMTCDNPQAAAELKARSAELQQALEQAGFDMSGGVSFDVAGDRGQQQRQQAWQDQNDNNGEAFRGRAFRAALDTAGDAADSAVNGALRLRRGVNAGLDLRI